MALSYQDARKLKREFRERTRPAIRAKLTQCQGLIKHMGVPTGDEDDKLIRKFNTLSIKIMCHAHNKTLPEAKKYFEKIRVVVDKVTSSQFIEKYDLNKEKILALKDGVKAMLELLVIVKTTCEADEIFKQHKERKHKKLARANKKGNKRKQAPK